MKIIKIILSILFYFSNLAGDELPDEWIACYLCGGVGNRMFQFSAAYTCSKENNIPLLLTGDFMAKDGIESILDNKFQYVLTKDLYGNNANIPNYGFKFRGTKVNPHCLYYNDELIHEKNIVYIGNFLSENWFKKYKEEIIQLLQPPEKLKKYIKTKYSTALSSPLTVGIHIRTWSPDEILSGLTLDETSEWAILLPRIKYLENAMNYFPDDALFIVASDDIKQAKLLLKGSKKKIIYSNSDKDSYVEKFTGNSTTLEDLYLLSFCDHNIITAGTFGWWAAYLNLNPEKMVITPLDGTLKALNLKNEYWPQGWIQLQVDS